MPPLSQLIRALPGARHRVVLTATLIAVAVAVGAGVSLCPPGALAQPPGGLVTYEPPVVAPVLDPFRLPAGPYGPGNRGIEYDTWPGQPVVAAAAGSVVFAGAVAGSLHVTIGHADGVRTSYAFLASIDVVRGQQLGQGELVGRAGETFHFGARIGSIYVDPAALFGAGPPEVALVPHDRPWQATSGRPANVPAVIYDGVRPRASSWWWR